MAYIGVQPTDTYLSIASQQITGTGSATYTLNYSVSNEEDVAVFVNNVRQNVSSYTVSGDQLTLGGTISASDECWVLFLGRTVGTKTPAVGSVTNDMLAGSIANAKLANSSVTVNGTSISLGASGNISAGITVADNWRLTTNFTGNAQPIASNLAQVNSDGQGTLGSAMTVSSGVFTFPSTGIYLVGFDVLFFNSVGNDSRIDFEIQVSVDGGSNWNARAKGFTENASGGGETSGQCKSLIDVNDTSQIKVRFDIANNQNTVRGSSANNQTSMMFIRLGDT